MMRTIDKASWSRLQHFEFFNDFNHPHFNMCANVDLTSLLPYIRKAKHPFTATIVYLISHAANAIPEFRYRIRGEEIVEHDTVSPALTILLDNGLFSFCTIDYSPNFSEFTGRASRQIAAVKQYPSLSDPPGRDDLLLMTAIPWVSFTSFMHPMRMHPADSFPRFAWGKYYEENGRRKMALSVQAHHALMDGFHMGKYYQLIQEYLEQPEKMLANGQEMPLPE